MPLWSKILEAGKINPVEQLGNLPLWQKILNAKPPEVPAFGTQPSKAPTPEAIVPLWQKIIGGQQGETFPQTFKRVGEEQALARKSAFDPNATPEMREKGQQMIADMTFGFSGGLRNVAKQGLKTLPLSKVAGKADDIAKAKASGQSFDDWVKGQGETVLHGTSEKFDVFSDTMKGSITGAESAKGAIWFTPDAPTAKAYSVYAAESGPINKLLEQQKVLERIAQKSGKNSDWVRVDKLTQKIDDLGGYDATYQRRLDNANVKEAVVKGDFLTVDAKGKSPQELSAEGDIDSWLNLQLEKARTQGKDGVVFKNLDDAVGLYNRPATHYAIFDSKNIKTSSQLKALWNEAK